MNRDRRRLRAAKRHGASVVEFALMSPVVFALTFASIELARANMIRNTLEIAAYEGARAGIVPGATVANCEAAAVNVVNSIGVNGVEVDSVIGTETATTTISVPIDQNMWCTPFFTRGMTITRSCTLAQERTLLQ